MRRAGQEEIQISQENGEARTAVSIASGPGHRQKRNEAILRARGDICFSDADIVYEDGYETAMLWQGGKSAGRHDHFNIEVEESRRTYHITGAKQVLVL